MLTYPDACVALFSRPPVEGRVKTRLIPTLGAREACALHLALLRRQLDRLERQVLCRAELWLSDTPGETLSVELKLPLRLQSGEDLGQRMSNGMSRMLRDSRMALIVGSDCPDLDENYLGTALESLSEGADLVLGPALDGGYVLIGLSHLYPELFQDIDWGSGRVLLQTLAVARSLGLQVTQLSPLADIDEADDLHYLPPQWQDWRRAGYMSEE